MRPAECIAIGPDRRFFALLGFSAALHAVALLWVKVPPQPLAAPAILAVLSASLRVNVGGAVRETETEKARERAREQAKEKAGAREQALPARKEVRQFPARRELQTLPATLEAAGPTTVAPVPEVPAIVAPAVAEPAADAARLVDNYGQRLSELFSRRQQYPRLAALRGWEGEVRVRLSVARQGSLTAVKLERSSGYEVLDRHALAMIEEIGRLPPPPAELAQSAQFSGDVQVVVPIHYKLRKPA